MLLLILIPFYFYCPICLLVHVVVVSVLCHCLYHCLYYNVIPILRVHYVASWQESKQVHTSD